MPKTELYIGNLNKDARQEEIEDVFKRYGAIKQCQLKNKGFGPVFAFIEFEDERDAEDALNSENGRDMCGASMVVQFAKGKDEKRERRGGDRGGDRDRFGGRGGGRGGRGGGRDGGRPSECFECGERGHFARDCRNRRGGSGGGGGRREFGRREERDMGRNNFRGERFSGGSRDRRDRSRSRSRSRD